MNTFITKEAFVSAHADDDVKYSSGDNVLSSSSTTTIDNRSPSSVVRQMFWNYPYSNNNNNNNNNNTSMHFLGGSSIFPTTTTTVSLHNNSNINKISGGPESRGTLLTTTTGSSRLHQHRRYHGGGSSTSTTTRNKDGQTTTTMSDPFIASTDCDPDCPSSWSESSLVISPYPRPTDQLLKLIRRRRGSAVHNSNNNNNSNNNTISSSSHPNHNDDSWNAVRYHIMNRPADCRYVCYKSNLSTPLHAACLYRAPHDVILMILTAWPAATLQQDAEGWNPLHIHILYNTVGSDMYYNTTMPSTTTTTTSHHHRYYRRPCTTTTTTTTTTITATESLIRFGGAAAASQHSKFVGSALHLACRHNVAASILAELLQVCPSQVYIPNEAGGLPANLQWKACYKDKTRLINTTNDNTITTNNEITQLQSQQQQQHYPDECHYDLFVKLNLFLAAFRNAPILLDQAIQCLQYPMFTLHDVIDFHYNCCSNQSDYVRLFVSFNPSSVFDANPERQWKLPLHTAASYSSIVPIHGKFYASNSNNNNTTTSMTAVNTNQHQVSRNVGSDTLMMGSSRLMVVNSTNEMLNQQQQYTWLPITTTNVPLLSGVTYGSTSNGSGSILYANTNLTVPHSPMDPLETLLRAYPEGVICKEIHTNRIPLHVALLVGKRTWHTGIASLVAVAPETVEWKDTVTNLFPFQLAAAVTDDPPGRQQQQPPKTTWSSGGTRIQEQRLKLQEEKEQLAQLETIYFLLLACPHLIIHPSSSSNQKAA